MPPRAAITNFFNSEVTGFGVDLRYSRLLRAIDDADPSIRRNNVKVTLLKKTLPVEGVSNGITFSFQNPLRNETRNSDPLNHDAIVQSSNFTYLYNKKFYDVAIQDDGNGSLFIYTKDGNNRVVLQTNIGTVNYTTGEMNLTLNPFSYDTSLDFRAYPESDDVFVAGNVFLSLNEETLAVEVEAE